MLQHARKHVIEETEGEEEEGIRFLRETRCWKLLSELLGIPTGFRFECSGGVGEGKDVERRIRDIPVTKEKNFGQSAC